MNKKISLVGFCYDEKSSYLQGPKLAPPLIRKAFHSPSANAYTELGIELTPDLYDEQKDYEIKEYFDIQQITSSILNLGHRLISIGGDHSIAYPIVKAHAQFYSNFSLLQIDAHGDLYDNFEGDPYSHACPFTRIMEEKLCSRLVQIGIRTLTQHQREQAAKFGVEIIEMKDYKSPPKFDLPVYISLDMDGFDPAYAPGVSHHEPGGFTARQVIDLIHSIEVPIIGADIVEYNPKRDHHDQTAFLAAKCLKEIMGKMITNQEKISG